MADQRLTLDRAAAAFEYGDTPAITTLERLWRSAQNMPASAEALRGRGAGLRGLSLLGDVGTYTPMDPTGCTVMAAPAQMGFEVGRERIADPVAERRAAACTTDHQRAGTSGRSDDLDDCSFPRCAAVPSATTTHRSESTPGHGVHRVQEPAPVKIPGSRTL